MTHMRPTTLRLSAAAIDRLLGDEPEFKLELQRAVVSEIVRRLMPNDMNELLTQQIEQAVANKSAEITKAGFDISQIKEIANEQVGIAIGNYRNTWNTPKLTSEKRKEFTDYFVDLIKQTALDLTNDLSLSIEHIVADRAAKIVKRFEDHFEQRLDRAVNKAMDEEIDKRVTEKIKKVLSSITSEA